MLTSHLFLVLPSTFYFQTSRLIILGFSASSRSYYMLRLHVVLCVNSTAVFSVAEVLFKNLFVIGESEIKRGECQPTICTITLIGKRNSVVLYKM